jgi:recombination protein RecR
MTDQGDPIQRLTHQLSRLPGIGEKTASRLAYHILRAPESYVRDLTQALQDIKTRIHPCSICCNLTDRDPCAICADARRSDELICVVEQPSDLLAIERGREYRGRYHILHGSLSPLDGIGPDQLRIQELLRRLSSGHVHEVIMATDPDVEGEATALYLARLIRPLGIKVTRLAHGIPVGSELEYVDHVTIQKALDNRREL